jgi:hypothetical protein
MCSGYVIVDPGTSKVLCLGPGKKSFVMLEVTDPTILNKAICAPDLTEAKNVLSRIQNSPDHKDVVSGVEIQHVARLYKKFY